MGGKKPFRLKLHGCHYRYGKKPVLVSITSCLCGAAWYLQWCVLSSFFFFSLTSKFGYCDVKIAMIHCASKAPAFPPIFIYSLFSLLYNLDWHQCWLNCLHHALSVGVTVVLVHAMLSLTLTFFNLSELCHAPIATMSILAFLSYAWDT